MSTIPPGYAPVPLPSRGLLYGGLVPDGVVHVRKLKVTEEAAIQSAVSGMDLVNAVVSTAVLLPAGLTHLDLLMTDRMALLIALRVHTFGREFRFTYKCAACGATNQHACDLGTELKSNVADDGVVEPLPVTLPDSGAVLGLRFLRGKDEAQIARASKRVAMQSNDAGDPSYILRKALQIVTVDGVEKTLPEREALVRDMTMPDSQAMSDAIDESESGVDITIKPECRHCGHQQEMLLPFSGDFFRTSRRKP